MTTAPHTALSEILEIARAAAAAGDTARARHYFRNLTEIDPTLIDGWLGYAASTSVLAERRALYARALELDAACAEARAELARADELLAGGKLLLPSERQAAPAALHAPQQRQAAVPEALRHALPGGARRGSLLALAVVAMLGVSTMGALTTFGIFVLTSFWGFMLAFLAGPAVSEIMVRLSARARKSAAGRPLQVAAAVGMILGGVGALVLGGVLMTALGIPLPVEAVQIARETGVGTGAHSVLLNNPGLLVFLSSAVAATVYRLR
jgi:hypothetical protein